MSTSPSSSAAGTPTKDPSDPRVPPVPPAGTAPAVKPLSAKDPLVLRGKELLSKKAELGETLEPGDILDSATVSAMQKEDEETFDRLLPSRGERFGRIPTMRSELRKLEKGWGG